VGERRRFDVLRTIGQGTAGDHWSVIYRTQHATQRDSAWGVYQSNVCNLATAQEIADALNRAEEATP
jgi:hypothetical protein